MKRLSEHPTVHETARVVDSRLGRYTEVGARTQLLETSLGDYSYVVNDGEIAYATIGKFCSIASHVRLNPGNHPMERASQAHFSYRAGAYWPEEEDDLAFFARRRAQPVVLGHDVWIGHGVVVLPGRTIGTGAVVGAGAVVTRDVAPYTVAVGNPARTVKRRFHERTAERLQRLAWWDWDHERLRRALPDFATLSAEAFLDKVEGGGLDREPDRSDGGDPAQPRLAAIYRGYIECLNARNWPELKRFVADEVRHNGRPIGLTGYREMLEKDVREIPDLRFDVQLLVCDPPYVASRLRFDCAPKGAFLGLDVDGRRVSFTENAFYRFGDQRIEEVWSVIDKAAIEAQL